MEPVLFYMLEGSEACRVAVTTLACKNGCVFLLCLPYYIVDIMGFLLASKSPKSFFLFTSVLVLLPTFLSLLLGLVGVRVVCVWCA